MRRKDREIVDQAAIRAVMEEAQVCRIGLSDDGMPYVVPMNFGLGINCIYLHCAREGRKIDVIRKNNRVCFEMDILHEVRREALRCGCSARFDSVIGFGRAVIVEDSSEKQHALDRIMEHYGAKGPSPYAEEQFAKTAAIRIDIESMTCKHHE
jgi:nitroimidazol reductase NimA-like FMN-containing flavoprotein (pyridoxamine 5'-phosphate oxidase superfamily)